VIPPDSSSAPPPPAPPAVVVALEEGTLSMPSRLHSAVAKVGARVVESFAVLKRKKIMSSLILFFYFFLFLMFKKIRVE
jgi:hypothetical protein